MIFSTIMLVLIFLVVFITAIGFLLLYFKVDNVPADAPIVYNFMTKFVPSATGLQIKRFSGPDREAMIIRKLDKSYMNLFKLKKKDSSEDLIIFFNENQLTEFPKGTLSPDRDIIILLPPHPEDLPEKVRNSKIGRAFSLVTEENDFNKKEVELIREYSNRKDSILKDWSGGEISSDLLGHMDKLFKDYMKTLIRDKTDTKNQFSFQQNREPYGGN